MLPARISSLQRILREYGVAALANHLSTEEATWLLEQPFVLLGLRPCEHPARAKHGIHEWYVLPMTGAGHCRACGATTTTGGDGPQAKKTPTGTRNARVK